MKIALIGYGKMGKAIEQIALTKGHEIALKIGKNNAPDFNESLLKNIDVAIEFSTPDSVIKNIKTCILAYVPIVVGTTAWQQNQTAIFDFCLHHHGTLLHASNFSLGVNLFFELNKKLAEMMATYPAYKLSMQEVHHLHKLDAPSGTAISLANDINTLNQEYQQWHKGINPIPGSIPIESVRLPDVPGTHSVKYLSNQDEIEIKHTAFNRDGFAAGALLAAEWIIGKKGIYTMSDVLGI